MWAKFGKKSADLAKQMWAKFGKNELKIQNKCEHNLALFLNETFLSDFQTL